ncbi:hypothetical protein [Ekhidna sp.]|uniref:hypothetical protein n=1 Tax=Ekhidna sp. TaxID=2608089 RepID=UPI003BA9BD5E
MILTMSLHSLFAQENTDENFTFPLLEGPYMGQKPPGMVAEPFAPGIVSIDGRFEGTVSFSPDLKEMYFAADNEDEEASIYFSRFEEDQWTPIKKANFTNGAKKEEFHPFVSPDGKRIYFTAMDSAFFDEKIWYADRIGDSWSDAVLLDSPINDDLVFFPNQAKNGDLYYFNLSKFGTYYAPNENGEFPEVQEVAVEPGHHAFISPSQDYLILTARNEEEGRKDNDMYVYFKKNDGTWTKPLNLGSTINTSLNEKAPRITPDGKYLFFGRDERDIEPGLGNIYWVSTEVIEKIRPKNYLSDFDFPILEGPYMGQEPPGMVAEPFAPGIISREGWELEGVFAPGMKEFYFTIDRGEYTNYNPDNFHPTVVGFRQENNVWIKYIEFPRRGEITFSPNGSRMHMAKGYKDRIGDSWSERKSLGTMFDREDWGIMRLSASANGTYVFDDYKNNDAIRISIVKNGIRQEPVKMSTVVNSGKKTAHPFIAPDESYLIWDSEREGGFGDSDLYISFKQKDGSWGPAINMGDKVNSAKDDFFASVTPDGKYILFNRVIDDGDNIDIYWIDALIIETFRIKEP